MVTRDRTEFGCQHEARNTEDWHATACKLNGTLAGHTPQEHWKFLLETWWYKKWKGGAFSGCWDYRCLVCTNCVEMYLTSLPLHKHLEHMNTGNYNEHHEHWTQIVWWMVWVCNMEILLLTVLSKNRGSLLLHSALLMGIIWYHYYYSIACDWPCIHRMMALGFSMCCLQILRMRSRVSCAIPVVTVCWTQDGYSDSGFNSNNNINSCFAKIMWQPLADVDDKFASSF